MGGLCLGLGSGDIDGLGLGLGGGDIHALGLCLGDSDIHGLGLGLGGGGVVDGDIHVIGSREFAAEGYVDDLALLLLLLGGGGGGRVVDGDIYVHRRRGGFAVEGGVDVLALLVALLLPLGGGGGRVRRGYGLEIRIRLLEWAVGFWERELGPGRSCLTGNPLFLYLSFFLL
jgi:hypothetical protein